MGVTSKSFTRINRLLNSVTIQSVLDLGAQNDYRDEMIRSGRCPFMSEWWKARGVNYVAIDLSGENGSYKMDLSTILPGSFGKFDLVCDFGTSEHVANLYNCLWNIHSFCKVGGHIIRENPEVGSWPGHGLHYITENFNHEFASAMDYKVIESGREAAMGNDTDGWNIFSVMQKTKDGVFCLPSDLPAVQTFTDDTYNREQKALWNKI